MASPVALPDNCLSLTYIISRSTSVSSAWNTYSKGLIRYASRMADVRNCYAVTLHSSHVLPTTYSVLKTGGLFLWMVTYAALLKGGQLNVYGPVKLVGLCSAWPERDKTIRDIRPHESPISGFLTQVQQPRQACNLKWAPFHPAATK